MTTTFKSRVRASKWRRNAQRRLAGRCTRTRDILLVMGGKLPAGRVAKLRYRVVESAQYVVVTRKSSDWNRLLLGCAARHGSLWKKKLFKTWLQRLSKEVDSVAHDRHQNCVTISMPKVPGSRETHEFRSLKYKQVLTMEATSRNLSWLYGYVEATLKSARAKPVLPTREAARAKPVLPVLEATPVSEATRVSATTTAVLHTLDAAPEVPLFEETPAAEATSLTDVPKLEKRMLLGKGEIHRPMLKRVVQADIRSFLSRDMASA